MTETEPSSPEPSAEAGEFCHHLGKALQKTADGTAGWSTRTYVRLHTATCTGCRDHLHALEAEENAGTILTPGH